MAKKTVAHPQALSLFNFSEHDIRVILDDKGNPWFIAKDICDLLGIQNSAQDRFDLDDDEVCRMYIPILSNSYTLVSESGLYTIILRSNKEKARPFRKWVTSEVLPSVRKTGQYNLLVKAFLRSEPAEWERRFPPAYYQALCRLFGWTYLTHTALPNVIGQITRRWIYGTIMPVDVLEELDARRGTEKLHQWLTEQAVKTIIDRINAVTITARQSLDYRDFNARCGLLFGGQNQQLSLLFPLAGALPRIN